MCLIYGAAQVGQNQMNPERPSAANAENTTKEVAQQASTLSGRLVPKPESREGDVVWTDPSLAEEARKLADALRETGYTKAEKAKRVELSRSGETRVLRVYMTAADAENPRIQRMLRDYAGLLWGAMAFEGKPLEMKLCDENRVEHHSYTVEPSSRYQCGPKCYVYHPSALRADAERFGRLLVRTGTADNPANWTLIRRGGTWLVCPGLTRDHVTESVRVSFRQTARQISDEAFDGERVELWVITDEGVETFSANR
jgi:hypothetical protein